MPKKQTHSKRQPRLVDDSHLKLEMWEAEIKEKISDAIKKLEDMKRDRLAMFELEFRNSLMALPKSVLNAPVDIDDGKFRAFILGLDEENEVQKEEKKEEEKEEKGKTINNEASPTSSLTRKITRRRSRSASNVKCKTSQRIHKVRSTSVDVYKTPKGRIRLSAIMSHKKYTVTKPKKPHNSGLHVKRIMKPDEEAISTRGSPLHVASGILGAPHVNIPLPGGVVLNIEPKSPQGTLDIPALDIKTKNQIKLLCQQLESLI